MKDRRPVRVRRVAARVLSGVWALLPLCTVGLLTPIIIGHAAGKLRSGTQAMAACGYLGMIVFFVAGVQVSNDMAGPAWLDGLLITSLFVLSLGGTVHAYVLRPRVFSSAGTAERHRPRRGGVADQTTMNLTEEELVLQRRRLRARAQEIAKRDPPMARELGIGRPDVRHRNKISYDDGGVIDVNSAPSTMLTDLPGIDQPNAGRIVALRESVSFVSIEDLAHRLPVNPYLVEELAPLTVFIPPRVGRPIRRVADDRER